MSNTIRLNHFIAGENVASVQPAFRSNPSDQSDRVSESPMDDGQYVNAAVAAARAAAPSWASATPETRADVLDRAGETLARGVDEFGELLSREEGKTLAEGRGEVGRAARILKFFAGEALRATGSTMASVRPGVEVTTHREPVGVFGLITPWNFPIAIPVWKSAAALAFGNTVVLKPSELTPAMAGTLARVLAQAGAPSGVINVVHGDGRAGAALCAHPDVDGVSFTGSVAAGARVAAAALTHQARLQLEMGGKNPLVVLDDADLDRAVQIAIDGAFFATGQRCTASSRLIVTDAIHDRFVTALSARTAALRVGHALDPMTQIGPLVSEAQLNKTRDYLDIARSEGAKVIGGERPAVDFAGHYITPAILLATNSAMRVNREEIFGPVASIIRVRDYDEALATANAGEFGLSAGIVTRSLKYAHDFRRAMRAGMTMVNLPTAGVDYHAPFGGSRKSSYGPHEQGSAAIEFFTQLKTSYLLP